MKIGDLIEKLNCLPPEMKVHGLVDRLSSEYPPEAEITDIGVRMPDMQVGDLTNRLSAKYHPEDEITIAGDMLRIAPPGGGRWQPRVAEWRRNNPHKHTSDCSIHNAPAYDPGNCDCSAVLRCQSHRELDERVCTFCGIRWAEDEDKPQSALCIQKPIDG